MGEKFAWCLLWSSMRICLDLYKRGEERFLIFHQLQSGTIVTAA
ncbi:MAG: hypothetical protein OEX77_10865 [Candidatus Bathyarchaeota archaeon]|nr:hypothetical protein [Candidatus Bathyarchaeota archaeon]MDH5732910.1 hypothetical protein [Candidatus Bathyarchaeota archaeon]